MAPKTKPKRERAKHFFREWRESRFPNQLDAEEALGWSQSKISRLEKGVTPYDQDDLEHAAAVFGCSIVDLISRPPGGKITDKAEAIALLRRLAIVPNGFEENAYELIASAWKGVGAQSPQNPPPGSSQDANRPRTQERSGKRVLPFSS